MAQPERRGEPFTPYPDEWIDDPTRLPALFKALDIIRAATGHPLSISSGYRSPVYNKKIYLEAGKPPTKSFHQEGRAADIYSSHLTGKQLHDLVLQLHKEGKIKIGGLGRYLGKNYIHVDVRQGWDHLARWTYK